MKDPLKNLRYPIDVFSVKAGRCERIIIYAKGAETDPYPVKKVYKRDPELFHSEQQLRPKLERQMTQAQMDQCAHECRNLWGPIWKNIWREVWDHNAAAMREERDKALKKYFR